MGKEYYNVLGVDKAASKDDIKKAYRKLAMEHHPDKNQGNAESEEKFKEISEAYSVLSDDQKRSNFDQFGAADGNQGGFNMNDFMRGNPFGDMFGGGNPFGGGSFSFENIFGGGSPFGNQQANRRGGDLRLKLEITLIDVRDSVNKTFKYNRKIKCNDCNGFGGEHTPCSACNGAGQVRMSRQTPLGHIVTHGDCPTCSGQGYIITNQCSVCVGTGVKDETTELNIQVPKGVENGDKFKLNGKGSSPFRPGKGGSYGDLIVELGVQSHPILVRNGINLMYNLIIPLPSLILGTKVEIPTLDGSAKIVIKAHSKVGDTLRLQGKGLADQRGTKGDQLITINVEIPDKLTKEERKLLEELSEMPNFKIK